MASRIFLIILWGALVLIAGFCQADQLLVSQIVSISPTVDGSALDSAWSSVPGIVTTDIVANIPMELKAVHTGTHIYFLVRYPDSDCSQSHRSWFWNADQDEYAPGNDREDVFVFKWFLSGDDTDLTLLSPTSYTADIWFWKACRTNGSGYADDKTQELSATVLARSSQLTSKTGSSMHLIRSGDEGKPAYKTQILVINQGPVVSRFAEVKPEGSRADIRAKGVWADGYWTIEFGRQLQTKHDDDVQLFPGQSYRLGVSRFEIAGRKEEPDSQQPKYGCGEISEVLTLEFASQTEERER